MTRVLGPRSDASRAPVSEAPVVSPSLSVKRSAPVSAAKKKERVTIDPSSTKVPFHGETSDLGALLPMIRKEAEEGRLEALVLDLDNVLFRPKGWVASEAQEWESTKSLPRENVLQRRDADERRMIRHGFFELGAGLDASALAEIEAIRSELGVKIIGLTARPEALSRRTKRILGIAGITEASFDRLLFTGGTGTAKVDRLRTVLEELGVHPSRAVVADDRELNVEPLAELGLSTIHVKEPRSNHSALTAKEWLSRASSASDLGTRFECLVNAFARSADRTAVILEAEKILSRRDFARFSSAVADLPSVLLGGERKRGEVSSRWVSRARAAIAPPKEAPPVGLAGDRWLEAAANVPRGSLGDLGIGEAAMIEAIAEALVAIDGSAPKDLSRAVADKVARALGLPAKGGVTLDAARIASFARVHLTEIESRLSQLRELRAESDLSRLSSVLTEHPELSLEEARRGLRLGRSYVNEILRPQLELDRPVDRLGEEPNFLFAAHLAAHLMRSTGDLEARLKSFDSPAVHEFWGRELELEDFRLLQKAYPFLAEDVSLDDLPADLKSHFESLAAIPFESEMIASWRAGAKGKPVLEGGRLVTVDHALADKLAFYRHLIVHEGARGEDIHVLWKNYSADPLVVSLADRCLGLSAEVASGDTDLESRTKVVTEALASDGSDQPILVHLQGVKAWGWLDALAAKHPKVVIDGVSHTTSDADEIRDGKVELSHVSASVMADSEAKIRYERFMFGASFERVLERLPDTFNLDLPGLDDRHLVLFGGAGKIIGSGVADALLRMKESSADGQGLFEKVTLIDPAFSEPAFAERKKELETAGFSVVAGKELPDELRSDRLFVVNATAFDVLSSSDYSKLEAPDLVFMNLGTGQKGASMGEVSAKASARRQIGPKGHQPSVAYDLDSLRLYALGDGYPYNLTERHPNPSTYSDFNNLLIILGLHHAKEKRESGKLGAEVLDLANVSFTFDESENAAGGVLPSHRGLERRVADEVRRPSVSLRKLGREFAGDFGRSREEPERREVSLRPRLERSKVCGCLGGMVRVQGAGRSGG
jgi:hypothetical protein